MAFVKAENENDLKELNHHGISSSDTRYFIITTILRPIIADVLSVNV